MALNGWTKAIALAVFALLGIPLVFVIAAIVSRSGRVPSDALVLVYLWAIAVACVLWRWLERRPFGDMGFTAGAIPGFLLGVVAGALPIVLFSGLLSGLGVLRVEARPDMTAGPFLLALGITLLQSSSEEVLFRGYLLRIIESARGPTTAIAITSAAFAVVHVVGVGLDPVALLNILLWAVVLGLAVLRWRSLWPAIGIHAGWNWAQQQILGFSVYGRSIEAATLATSLPSGHVLISGGSVGPEGSVITTVVLAAVAVVVWSDHRHSQNSTAAPPNKRIDNDSPRPVR